MTPLADLHRHLDGSLRDATARELAAHEGIAVPRELGFHAGMGLAAALDKFAFTLALLQTPEAVRRVAGEMCADAAAEGVTTLEIRFAPQLHLRRGAAPEAIIDAALEGAAGRAGIILCALYGDSPDVLASLLELGRPIAGVDLAGGPTPGASFGLADYARPFRRAAELGLGRTVHAGEGRPAAEIRVAIELLGAQRIGHGTTLLDDPAVVELVIARQITIEACPTSNVHTGVIPDVASHPLPRWLDAGVRACINTDNTLFSAVDSPTEHRRARAIPGMDDDKLARAIAYGHSAAF